MKWLIGGFGFVMFLVTVPVFAHHSFAMFDTAEEVTLNGTVKEFQWTNPHTWIQILVPSSDGSVIEWSIEGASPNGLKRAGWSSKVIKPGDKVVAIIHPLKDGQKGGSLVSILLPDGTRLGRGATPSPQSSE